MALSIDESTYEILYGGARGGGKTDAGIVWLLKGVDNPSFTGMCIRRNHTDLRQWIDRAIQLYPHAKVSGKPVGISISPKMSLISKVLSDLY